MQNILDATSSNRRYVEGCAGRMVSLARSADMLGMDKLAEELDMMAEGLLEGVDDVNKAVGEALQQHVHGINKASDNMFQALVQGVAIGAEKVKNNDR